MMPSFSVFYYFWILARTVLASDIFSTLRSSNATLFADVIEKNPALCALVSSSRVHTIFAPVDSVLANHLPSQRMGAIRRADISLDEIERLSYKFAEEQQNQQSPDSLLETLSKRGSFSLPFLFTTASDDVPANLEVGQRQKFTMIDSGVRCESKISQCPDNDTSVLQLVTGLGNKVNVVKPGIQYDGGSIYTIDGLFTVPTKLSRTLATLSDTTSFGALLNSSNLTTALDSQRGGTFFIPSNAALAALGYNQTLSKSAIQHHVVQGVSAYLPSLAECKTLKTAEGGEITVTKSANGEHYIDGAKIISTNIILENGVAYVIDKTLELPVVPIDNAASLSLCLSIRNFGAFVVGAVFTTFLLA